MSAIGGKADITISEGHICFCPKADIAHFRYTGLSRYDAVIALLKISMIDCRHWRAISSGAECGRQYRSLVLPESV
jgi:hypothetical protein